MSRIAASPVEAAMQEGRPWLFLSPHLDDAVLSCGALIGASANHREVTVTTIFTESRIGPHTRAARSFMRQCSVKDAQLLFEARRAEDRAVLSDLGVKCLHLGVSDALYRQREQLVIGTELIGRLVPELVHRYPTYRFDIARGRIAHKDRDLITELQARVSQIIDDGNVRLVFCPLGVGRHVDHLITRMVGEKFPDLVVYYSDFPYNQTFHPDPSFISSHGLRPWAWSQDVHAKQRLIRGYTTQADALFPGGRIPVAPEIYYCNDGTRLSPFMTRLVGG